MRCGKHEAQQQEPVQHQHRKETEGVVSTVCVGGASAMHRHLGKRKSENAQVEADLCRASVTAKKPCQVTTPAHMTTHLSSALRSS